MQPEKRCPHCGQTIQAETRLAPQEATESDFILTPQGLADLWVFNCRAMKNRARRDKMEDVSIEFAEWIECGVPAEMIRKEIEMKRDRTEHLWQFKRRLQERLQNGPGKLEQAAKQGLDWASQHGE